MDQIMKSTKRKKTYSLLLAAGSFVGAAHGYIGKSIVSWALIPGRKNESHIHTIKKASLTKEKLETVDILLVEAVTAHRSLVMSTGIGVIFKVNVVIDAMVTVESLVIVESSLVVAESSPAMVVLVDVMALVTGVGGGSGHDRHDHVKESEDGFKLHLDFSGEVILLKK